MLLSAVTDAVELSIFIEFDDCRCPKSFNVDLKMITSSTFMNKLPIATSVAENITFFMIDHTVYSGTFDGRLFIGYFI